MREMKREFLRMKKSNHLIYLLLAVQLLTSLSFINKLLINLANKLLDHLTTLAMVLTMMESHLPLEARRERKRILKINK
jgi:hypothetical protein